MSLATRCSKCGTIFRVVQDQLKVSEGWVRCGRCQEVFNALEGLFDLEREAPPQRPRAALTATQLAAQEMAEFVASRSASTPAGAEAYPDTHEDDALESRFLARANDEDEGDPDFVDARFPSELPLDAADDAAPAAEPAPPTDAVPEPPTSKPSWRQRLAQWRADRLGSMPSRSDEPPAPPAATTQEAALPPGAPGFLREAAAEARWRRPRVRASLVVAAALLLGALAVQVAVQFRDTLATRWLAARPALETLCELAGCEIRPLRQLAALTVDASALTRVEGSEAYRLSLTLLNRSDLPLALPSVDLRITDAAGSLIARRALAPADFRALPGGAPPAAVLPAGSDAQWQTLFVAEDAARISGYTVELFYP